MITKEVKRDLKSKAHALKPLVLLGYQGLTPAVLSEIDLALQHHELIKIKLPQIEREARQAIIAEILLHTQADLVQSMGRIATLYKEREDELSDSSAAKAAQDSSFKRPRSRN